LHTNVVLAALNMALAQPKPSNHGSQYTSIAFGNRCRKAGVQPSMGSVGDAYDNAMAESFFATLWCELLDRRRLKTQAEARMAVFAFIEGFYNPKRRHSALAVNPRPSSVMLQNPDLHPQIAWRASRHRSRARACRHSGICR
jgi:putative transposase